VIPVNKKVDTYHHPGIYLRVPVCLADALMKSLKAYTPALARLLGTTPQALYERQRALVRADMFNAEDVKDGRGPGSGVRGTAQSVALLLIGAIASDSLIRMERQVSDLAEAKPVGADLCPLTRMPTFLDALTRIITSGPLPHWVTEIVVSRTAARATIVYRRPGRKERRVEFAGPRCAEPDLRVTATLAGKPLRMIAADVTAMVHEKFDEIGQGEKG
jgi:hypothetical protein